MRAIPRGPAVLAGCTILWISLGCAPFRGITEEAPLAAVAAPDPEASLRTAVVAIDERDYSEARHRLLALAHECAPPSPEVRDRAALLLASIAVAARMLARSSPGNPDAALAQVLYTLALDRGAKPVDPESDLIQPGYGCPADPDHVWPDAAPLPEPIASTTAQRLADLEHTLAVRTDSLRLLQERLAAAHARTEALEAEIERIRKLLRGPGPDTIRRHER
jgi:hypothetical protein